MGQLALDYNVDIIALAECPIEPEEALDTLNGHRSGYVFPFSPAPKIRIFTRFKKSWVRPVFDDPLGHVSIRRLVIEERTDVLLAVAHVQSKLYWSDRDQIHACAKLSTSIQREEERFRHRRTILVGDFNMNPFEEGVVAAPGLHAVMAKSIAEAETREVDATHYPFFYNPMWSFFGDRSSGPPGTYYYREARPVMYFWNMFDQVLLRPSLMHALTDLQILSQVGGINLLARQGWPDISVGSDHLPLFFRLEL